MAGHLSGTRTQQSSTSRTRVSGLGCTGLGKVIAVQGNLCSWLFLGRSGRALQPKPKEILHLISTKRIKSASIGTGRIQP